MIVSNIDSRMTSDYFKLVRGEIDQGTFDKKILLEKQSFRQNLERKVKKLLPGGQLPELGTIEIIEIDYKGQSNRWLLSVVFSIARRRNIHQSSRQ